MSVESCGVVGSVTGMAMVPSAIGTSGSAVEQAGGGASEPTVVPVLSLEDLNKASAKIGTFMCGIYLLRTEVYTYRRRSGAGTVTQHKLSCLLLGRREEGPFGTSCYCMGHFKGEEAAVKAMAGKFTAN